MMLKVKLTPYRHELGAIYHRQTVGHRLTSADGRYCFFIDVPISDPDFWVVQGKGLRQEESCHMSPANTIMLATEPRSVLVYPKAYLRQFGLVCTCQEQTRHPNVHLAPAILPWFVGFTEDSEGQCSFTLDRDRLLSEPTPKKTKVIAVVTSNKAFTQGHLDRIRFVERLKAYYGERMDIFGRGFNDFADKWDVLAPYKYHIAIENSSQDYYWTEKLSDCYLAHTFPFYYGCTNVGDYFPREAFEPIDIHHFDKAVETIDKAIAENRYERSVDALDEAKRRVLYEYDMFEYIAKLCDMLHPDAPKQDVVLKPCRSSADWHNLFDYTFKRNFFKLKMSLHNLFGVDKLSHQPFNS